MGEIRSTVTEIVTEIMMSRENLPWLAVEGFTDEFLLRARNFSAPVKIVVGYGWEGVRDIIAEYTRCRSKAILVGLVDRDYRDHNNCQLVFDNLIFSDMRDVENMMFNSSALGRVISECASISKVPLLEGGFADIACIKDKIYSVAVKLGRFRVYCENKGLHISFKDIEHKKFICDNDLSLSVDAFLLHVNGKNHGKQCLKLEDWSVAQGLRWDGDLGRPEFLANGHDVMAITSVALRKMWGTHGGSIDAATVERLFRIGYSDADLENTQMWCQLYKHTSVPIKSH